MSEEEFQEVTQQSWGERLKGAIVGILFGFGLFLGAFPLLFYNEGRAVETFKSLEEGGRQVVSVADAPLDSANEGKLVHVTGLAVTDAVLRDEEFGVSANAIRLNRQVEMYQWREERHSREEKQAGGGTRTITTYKYKQGWVDHPIDSSGFKRSVGHQNPEGMPYRSQYWTADEVKLGAFRLSRGLTDRMSDWVPVVLESDPPALSKTSLPVHADDERFYLGDDPSNPRIGDLRIRFQTVEPAVVSIISRQVGNGFAPYHAEAGGIVELLQSGTVTPEAMIEQAQFENQVLTWVLRGAGLLVMFFGLRLIFKVFSVAADLLPIVGNIVEAGSGVVAFLLALVLSSATIGVAWLFYRPLLGGAILLGSVLLLVLTRGRLKKASPMPNQQTVVEESR